MFQTRTVKFPIGLRRMGWGWQKDTGALAQWAADAEEARKAGFIHAAHILASY